MKGLAGAFRTPSSEYYGAHDQRPPRRFSTSTSALPVRGGGVGHGHRCRTRPRRAFGFRRQPDAPPLSHPVATARNGGGRPGRGSPSRSDRRPLRRMRPRPATHIPRCPLSGHAAGAAPRPISRPSPVDAPSSSEDYSHIFLLHMSVKRHIPMPRKRGVRLSAGVPDSMRASTPAHSRARGNPVFSDTYGSDIQAGCPRARA